ncbi:MAG: ribose-phosphate diphosphokinase [Desulfatibacillaceae bacterium]
MYENGPVIFTGNANPALAGKICDYLEIPLGKAMARNFSDGETRIEIQENVRGKDVFVIQSTCPPVNENTMELLVILDGLKRSSVRRITAVVPYFGYARQDKKVAPRVPISAKLVADLLTTAGAARVITMDLHAGQIQGFFDIPVDNLFAMPVIIADMKECFAGQHIVIVSPDAGGAERARSFAKHIDADLAMIDKRRSAPNKAHAMNVIGDVSGKTAVILDDMADTAGTLCEAANALTGRGATSVHAYVSHPVLSGPAVERIRESAIESFVVTDTIPLNEQAQKLDKIRVITIAPLVAEAIIRSHRGDSVSSLFV